MSLDNLKNQREQQRANIARGFSNDLEKGRKAAIGTVSTHGGRKMQKTANGWVPVKDSDLLKDYKSVSPTTVV